MLETRRVNVSNIPVPRSEVFLAGESPPILWNGWKCLQLNAGTWTFEGIYLLHNRLKSQYSHSPVCSVWLKGTCGSNNSWSKAWSSVLNSCS